MENFVGKHILIVEDSKINQKILQKILDNWGINSSVANNGYEAIYLTERNNYDLILMDLKMPEMDGFKATTIIRDSNSAVLNHDVIIVALTVDSSEEAYNRSFEVGMNYFIQKPYTKETLQETFEKIFI